MIRRDVGNCLGEFALRRPATTPDNAALCEREGFVARSGGLSAESNPYDLPKPPGPETALARATREMALAWRRGWIQADRQLRASPTGSSGS